MRVRVFASKIKRAVPLSFRVHVVAGFVPRRFWYGSEVRLSLWQGRVSSIGSRRKATWLAAVALEWWLAELTRRGGFPVRFTVVGLEALTEAVAHSGGVLLCGVHLPGMRVAMRGLIEHGVRASFIVTAEEHIAPEGEWLATGCTEGLYPVVQGPMALMQMRGRLQAGEVGALLMDRDPLGPFYPNGMRLVGRLGAQVVLVWAELEGGGVKVTCKRAPHPVPDTEDKVWENLAVLDEQRVRILADLEYPGIRSPA